MKKIVTLSVFLVLLLSSLFAQNEQITVKGKIVNAENGQPLAQANILLKGQSKGVSTDTSGAFSIKIPKGQTLIFSYVGFENREFVYSKSQTVLIELKTITTVGDEVVVIGYGTQKRSSVTGAVSKFKNERLDESPVSRLDQALQGKIAGVQVSNISSEAGSDPKVQVRGVTSVNAGQNPLVVVDGQIVPDGLAFVNMTDVESVEVLKDAASAAIYGSRGASGVILITTKSGRADKVRYNLKVSYGVKNPYKVYPIMTTSDYLRMLYSEAALRFADTAWTNYATPAQINAKANLATAAEKAAYLVEQQINGGIPTDWQQAGLRTGQLKNVDLSVSGGNATTKYFISGSYQNDQGMIKHSEYERFNLRSKLDIQLAKKLKLTININPSYITRERPSTNFTDFARVQSYLPVTLNETQAAWIRQNPTYATVKAGDFGQPKMFNDLPYTGTMPDGSTFSSTGAVAISSSANNSPYSILETRKITTTNYRILSSADLSYTIIPGLVAKSMVSVYMNYNTGLDFAKTGSNTPGDVNKGVYINHMFFDLLNENTLNYTKKIKEHSFTVLAGFTAEKVRIDSQQITATNFISDNITTLNTALSITQDPKQTYNFITRQGLLSYLGRINYSYANKYLFAASVRADGSAKFGPSQKWGYFPSLSVGWVISKEKFLNNVKWLDNLKLRGSYGGLGNNGIKDYLFTEQLFSSNYITGAGTGALTQGLAPSSSVQSNPNITWERTFSFNGGVDASLFKGKVNVTVEVYQSRTEKLLLEQEAMGITGVSRVINNKGSIQNNGVEIELSTVNINRKNFKWTTSANFAHVQNKVLELGSESQLLNTGERQDVYLSKVGGPLIQYYNFKTDGIWLSQNEVNQAIAKGLTAPNLSGYFTPGALKFKDIDGNNIIDLNDRTVLGNPYPDFTWGITNTFNYKGFDVSFTFQGVQGGKLINGDGFYNETRKYNRAYSTNRWISPANPGDGKTPYFTNGYTNAWTQSDYVIYDATYFALREVLIGYTMPSSIIRKMKLNTLRFYISAQNPYYFFNKSYIGINPEARTNTGVYASPLLDGYQRGAFPINKSLLFGIDVNF